jgi:hypothetical protein
MIRGIRVLLCAWVLWAWDEGATPRRWDYFDTKATCQTEITRLEGLLAKINLTVQWRCLPIGVNP